MWCHLYIHEGMRRPGFELNKIIIGHGGRNTGSIYEATRAKIRLRGHGSGHLEGGREAPVPFMLAVIGTDAEPAQFQKAVERVAELLQGVEKRFKAFCKQHPQFRLEDGDVHFWIGGLSDCARQCLQPILDDVSIAPKLRTTDEHATATPRRWRFEDVARS